MISKWILKLMGWKVVGEPYNINKCIIVLFPSRMTPYVLSMATRTNRTCCITQIKRNFIFIAMPTATALNPVFLFTAKNIPKTISPKTFRGYFHLKPPLLYIGYTEYLLELYSLHELCLVWNKISRVTKSQNT